MPILAGDIKLVASQVMDDIENGGGAPTPTAIQDGVSNSIFNDISELDRAGGRVNLRKVIASVQTQDTDTYLGGNIILAEPPDDQRVHVTIFKTDQVFDVRTDARDRIEAYLNKGGLMDGYLWENHISGQRSVTLFQRESAAIPNIGRTLYLVANEGLGNEYSQYVRITRTTVEKRAFTFKNGSEMVDYAANVVICEVSDALRHDFPGSVASRLFTPETGKTKIRDTIVADAAKYYGASRITVEANIGDLSTTVESIFTQLVPSAQSETALIDVNAAGNCESLIDSANGTVSIATSAPFSAGDNIYIGNAAVPGSLSITVSGGTLTDSGGELLAGTSVIGTVDYARGVLAFASSAPTYSGSKTITFRPAAAPIQLADSAAISVGIENRSYNYIQTIIPAPAPKTLVVSYMAQGKWYDLRDNGAGAIKGVDPTFGAGSVSYSTGTVAITLGALPDVGSEIIYSWGATASYINRAAVSVAAPKVELQLAQTGITPGTVVIVWNDGVARSASDDGQGNIIGDATGKMRYQAGLIEITPNNLPAGGQSYVIDYSHGAPLSENFSAPARNGNGSLDLALTQGGLATGTVEVEWNLKVGTLVYESTVPAEMQAIGGFDAIKIVRDDGAGNLKDAAGLTYGSVNYTNGVVHLIPDCTVSVPVASWAVEELGYAGTEISYPGATLGQKVYRNRFGTWDYEAAGASLPNGATALVKVRYCATGDATSVEQTISTTALAIDLTANYAENIVPGSVNFTLGGKNYFDRLGQLYYNLDPATGNATLAGNVNYQTGAATLSAWVPGQANTLEMHSLLTSLDGNPVDEVVFRVPIAPVRPSSVQLLATKLSGGTLNVTADANGHLIASGCIGVVDYETGVVRARFGSWVAAAGNESAVWYDAAAVFNGQIFKPAPVFADTIRYNAVAYSYLPLDADILGLDPVRLPQDGRVPIFRKGDFAVVGHTDSEGPLTVSNGQTVNCGRVRLSRVRVIGSDGNVIDTGYTADLEAGTVTFNDVSGYPQPATIEHRIEDMAQVSDVQISGQLAFTRQITHAYPIGSVVSSALVAGDMRSRIPVMFDQASWDGTYNDTVVGGAATGTYNDVLSPIVVTNIGASTERWCIQFTNTTTFNVIGEHVGVIATGNTSADIAPINPATGQPYFSLAAIGWGAGWSAGNVLRFNTVGALFPVWVVRTVQQGPETVTNDSFTILIRGDVDRP